MVNDTFLAMIGSQALLLVATVAAVRTRVGGVDTRVKTIEHRKLEDEFVPRRELLALLENIRSATGHTNSLVQALIYAGGDRGIAIKAIEAAADAGISAALDWLEPYLHLQLPRFEGRAPYFYLDTDGYVTIGCGTMVPDAAAALKLPLHTRDGSPASPQAIVADFNRVAKMPRGRFCTFYRCPTSLTLSVEDTVEIDRERCLGFIAQLRAEFPGFDGFPAPAKPALLDMIYNLGLGREPRQGVDGDGLLNYTHLCGFVSMRRWAAAAGACERDAGRHAFDDRNAWTKRQFLAAAQENPL